MEFLALFLGKRDQRFRERKSMITFHFEAHKLGFFKNQTNVTLHNMVGFVTKKSHFNISDFIKAIW